MIQDFRLRGNKYARVYQGTAHESSFIFNYTCLRDKHCPTRTFRSGSRWSRCLRNSLVFWIPNWYLLLPPRSQGTFQIYTNFTLNKFKKFRDISLTQIYLLDSRFASFPSIPPPRIASPCCSTVRRRGEKMISISSRRFISKKCTRSRYLTWIHFSYLFAFLKNDGNFRGITFEEYKNAENGRGARRNTRNIREREILLPVYFPTYSILILRQSI